LKLRIKGNSIRLRLGQSEVRQLAIDGTIEESTAFGPLPEQCFVYTICAASEQHAVRAIFEGRRIVICVPMNEIHLWATTDQVGIHALQQIGDGDELRILIEKDFECIDAPAEEPQEDAFPNPQLGALCTPARSIQE
jgi:hypothetical protein